MAPQDVKVISIMLEIYIFDHLNGYNYE